ncbi:MAG TPA: cyclodeaminase/cyclohydrolase family protein [Steroidobacteraceae bacterium]|nr:cyclodeaminase/cyclohydrolase family protein [Steroidobacteraceae bacterium]
MHAFLDRLASAAPTPGGGGAAAATAAMGAALLSMATRLTLGKKLEEPRRADLQAQLTSSEALRAGLTELVAADARAVDRLIEAYRMPAADEQSRAARAAAVDSAMRTAVQVPLDLARSCLEGIHLANRCVASCHRNVAGDAAAGVLALQAALRTCALNISINAPALQDAAYAARSRAAVAAMLGAGLPLADGALRLVSERLAIQGV